MSAEALNYTVPNVRMASNEDALTQYVESIDGAIRPSVINEVAELANEGLDVSLVHNKDPYALSAVDQSRADAYIDRLASSPTEGREEFCALPAMSVWDKSRRTAMALQVLYSPSNTDNRLGWGIDPTIYERPIFTQKLEDGVTRLVSAKDILAEKKTPEAAQTTVDNYKTFVNTPVDEESRLMYAGCKDGQAIRSRGYATIDVVFDHFKKEDGTISRQDLRSASIACGAAVPVTDLVNFMKSRGANFESMALLDKDVIALASAKSFTESQGLADESQVIPHDLLKEKLTESIEPGSVDIADLLGLVEYIPNDERFGDIVVNLLKQVKEIMRPGGIVVFGNMLPDRPQQTFFEKVVKWPRLYQRSVRDMLEITQKAGFDLEETQVRIPAREGVYAIYALKIPEENTESVAQPYPTAA